MASLPYIIYQVTFTFFTLVSLFYHSVVEGMNAEPRNGTNRQRLTFRSSFIAEKTDVDISHTSHMHHTHTHTLTISSSPFFLSCKFNLGDLMDWLFLCRSRGSLSCVPFFDVTEIKSISYAIRRKREKNGGFRNCFHMIWNSRPNVDISHRLFTCVNITKTMISSQEILISINVWLLTLF